MAYWMIKLMLTPVLRFLYRVDVEGLEQVPARGPVIIASNHVSFIDSIFLPLVLRRRITFVAKAEYFENRKTAWFFRAVGQIPIKRTGGTASEGALAAASEVLHRGGIFGIYPEGTRSPDGRLYKGHTGVARLALQCGAPVICAAMIGTREVQSIGQVMPRVFMPVGIRFSHPVRFGRSSAGADGGDPGEDPGEDPMALRRITDEIMFSLRELSGQAYVNRYAKRRDVLEGPTESPTGSPLVSGRPVPHDRQWAVAVASR
jgi:1-acyl-sn-glycerol-3-phosphate acyltransferase